ncbi:MAG TPA: M1 family aminopeptidase [Bryobacteraceae bacterium]|nr:M1 family aminopeptidase [Bryobacteraceae bacterium]
MRCLAGWFLLVSPLLAGTGADLARAIRENSFDRDECYRVRDLTLTKEDIRIFLTDGHLIFSKPVAGRRIAAVFAADVEGGDGEVLLMPPDRAERRSLAGYIDSPNLDDHFRTALFLFTGDDYDRLVSQFAGNPTIKKTPELGAVMDEQWTPVLRNLSESYQTRLTLDLLGGPGRASGLFAAVFSSPINGNFDISYDPTNPEQILAGRLNMRDNRLYFDVWTSFPARSFRQNTAPRQNDIVIGDYRIDATLDPDLTLSVVTRVKVKPVVDGLVATAFDIAAPMEISQVTVDGRPAEVLQRESLRQNATRGGNNLFLVLPPEPLRLGREYEFEFHHSGRVIRDAGDRVFYVTARGNWYPMHADQFALYDMTFRYPKDLDLVSAGEVVEDRTEGEWRITRRRASSPIRVAAFNLGNYAHVRLERGGYVIDVCANRALERSLQPKPTVQSMAPPTMTLPNVRLRRNELPDVPVAPAPPDPLGRLRQLASEVASALEFMASKFGPPATAHLTVSPIPGAFGQGFPGLIYLSTFSYLNKVPGPQYTQGESQTLFFQDVLQAHEVAHQWWGNLVTVNTYRDYWLMEALANYSALLHVEKSKGQREMDRMLDSYRSELLLKGDSGQTVESAGPIVLGRRLETSLEPRAWRAITYGKGSWILQMLRRRLGDERFFSMLGEAVKRYNRRNITTEAFRDLAAHYLPPKSDDPDLESFFEQWVYGTGIPTLNLTYALKGKAPALKLVGTLRQSDVDGDFSALVPVEIQMPRGRGITHWVSSGNSPVTFTIALKEAPLKVALDPHHAVLRR